MFVLFLNQSVAWEAHWRTFLAVCDSEKVAAQIALKYCFNVIESEIQRLDSYEHDSWNDRKNKLKTILEELQTSSTLEQINDAWLKYDDEEGPFDVESVELIKNADDFQL